MDFFRRYLRAKRGGILLFFLCGLLFFLVFLLNHLPVGAFFYPAVVSSLFGVVYLVLDCRKHWERHHELQLLMKLPAEMAENLPAAETDLEEEYQQIFRLLLEEQVNTERKMNQRYEDMMDYYTIWVHQIKTPIASMRLKLQNEDSAFSRTILGDLFRIEQYVEMVLCYLRLDSEDSDYVFRELELDDLIRQAVRKFAGQFILRKIRLNYEAVERKVLTDEKWLLFVLEQMLSNALKYTESGSVSIYCEEDEKMSSGDFGKAQIREERIVLCIRDTGIGIAPEDLPRVFERGYTGYNGRNDKKASGLGLYLCRRICRNLGHTITVSSTLGEGTVVRIGLGHRDLEME